MLHIEMDSNLRNKKCYVDKYVLAYTPFHTTLQTP